VSKSDQTGGFGRCGVPGCTGSGDRLVRFLPPTAQIEVQDVVCESHYRDVETWKNHAEKADWIEEVSE
ncbi:MAG: hypothetical protein SV253_08155, partial [Halobacteria archaeon]|nr:hypothetical protein [Halobacteria archaeon]